MRKKAYSVSMTYEVSDAEKMDAEKAMMCFTHAIKLLNLAHDHLNIMKTPFKDHPDTPPQDIINARAAIRRFRDKSVENFNDFKMSAFKCVHIMQTFSSDTQTVKLMKSFISAINTLEIKVNQFVDLFADLESKDFTKNIVEEITKIQDQCDDIIDIVDERIKNHIQTNILASSWVDSVSNDLQMKIEEKNPLVIDLFNERQDQLNEIIRERSTLGN